MIAHVCIPCRRELRCIENAVMLEVRYEDPRFDEIFSADLWSCDGCGYRLITGVAKQSCWTRQGAGEAYETMKTGEVPVFVLQRGGQCAGTTDDRASVLEGAGGKRLHPGRTDP